MPTGKYIRTQQTRDILSRAKIGNTNGFKKGVSLFKGKKHSNLTRRKISDKIKKNPTRYWLGKKRLDIAGANNKWWQGGSNIYKSVRSLTEYTRWRSNVFQRDNWTCQTCGVRGVYLEVHHVKGFASIIKENNIKDAKSALNCAILWDMNNGVTLCKSCHALTDNFRGKR